MRWVNVFSKLYIFVMEIDFRNNTIESIFMFYIWTKSTQFAVQCCSGQILIYPKIFTETYETRNDQFSVGVFGHLNGHYDVGLSSFELFLGTNIYFNTNSTSSVNVYHKNIIDFSPNYLIFVLLGASSNALINK